jgi:hypothetical protein
LWVNPDHPWKRRTSPLETQHVVEARWSIATERNDWFQYPRSTSPFHYSEIECAGRVFLTSLHDDHSCWTC